MPTTMIPPPGTTVHTWTLGNASHTEIKNCVVETTATLDAGDGEVVLLEDGDDRNRAFACELKADDDDEGTFIATVTTGTPDRHKEVVVAKGLDLENFQKLPTILFGHDHNALTIGKALWIRAKGNKIIAKVKMAPTEFAQEVFQLIKGGFLGAVSIGFRGTDNEKNGPPNEKELKKNPEWASVQWVWRATELLEFSVVNVPANPEALITAVSKGHVSLSKNMSELLEIDDIAPVDVSAGHIVTDGDIPKSFDAGDIPHAVTSEPILTPRKVAALIERRILHHKGRMIPI